MEFCTIIAKNYLAYARTLAESIALHHPGVILKVLVIDGDAATQRSGPHHEIVTPADIDIAADEFRSMAIIYDVMELATAMKPWLLRWLLDGGASSVAYLDPDIQVFAPLHDLDELARAHGIVLTPHRITAVPRDGLLPSETVILQSGVYNLGFIAVGPSARPFLEWWATRLRRDCVIAHAEGLFVDQRFVDLVPSLFEHHILKDPAYNVAYWNADERSVTRTAQGYEVNCAPLRFFHFSGYRLDDPQHLSKFTAAGPRVILAKETAIAELCRAYGDALIRNALHDTAATPYGFARSHGGLELTRSIRRAYRQVLKEAEEFKSDTMPPDPFDPAQQPAFIDWLNRAGVGAEPKPSPAPGGAIVSSSQNAEDIRLWRAFGDRGPGFYVDVGAGDPVDGSVTRFFYDRGWSGINIEPGPLFPALEQARPRDVNLRVVAGAVDGLAEFSITYPDPHLSTTEPDVLRWSGDRVERVETVKVTQRRLETILAEYASNRRIDFLKVDVEGSEKAVLESSDWTRFRPAVVIVEAIKPWSREQTTVEWEAILTDNGYIHVCFDGINRWYVSRETASLAEQIAYPISALDEYRTHGEQRALDQAGQLERALAAASARARKAETRLRAVTSSRRWRTSTALVRVLRPIIYLLRAGKRAARGPRPAKRTAEPGSEPGDRAPSHHDAPLAELGRLLAPPPSSKEPKDEELAAAIARTGRFSEPLLGSGPQGTRHRAAVLEAEMFRALHRPSPPPGPARGGRAVVDVRCFQDPDFRRTAAGGHAEHVLRLVATGIAAENLALIVDPALGDLDGDLARLGSPSSTVDPQQIAETGLFVSLSPLSSGLGPVLRLLVAPGVRRVASVFDLGSVDAAESGDVERISKRAKLEALGRSDVLLVPSKEVGSALRRFLGLKINALVTGELPATETVDARVTEALATGALGRDEADQEQPHAARRSRPRLAVFTPLPPQRTGVGDYSATTFAAVADHADVVVYSDPSAGFPDGPLEIRPYALDPFLDRTFDAVVTVLGNSLFHIPALEYFHEFGGPCIAHDPWMAGVYSFRHGPQALARLLSRHAGRTVLREEIPEMLEDPDRLPATAYDEIASRARPLLVHSEKIAERILSETGVRSVVLPYVPHRLPRAATLDEAVVANARESLGWHATELHVVTFGIVHRRAKAMDVLLEALAALRANGCNAYAHFVGSAPANELHVLIERAEALGISQYIDLTGWVPGDTFERYLLAADAAVQLRTYARVPLSGALLDCIAFGIPTVSTRSLAEEMKTPGYITGVSDDLGMQAVAEALELLLRTPRVHSIGVTEPERRAWLSDRTTDVYARRLLDALGLGSA